MSKVEKFKVGDVPVTYLDVHGTYKYKKAAVRARQPGGAAAGLPHAARSIFDSTNGPYFIRLIGPAATVAQNKKGFDDWLKSFK